MGHMDQRMVSGDSASQLWAAWAADNWGATHCDQPVSKQISVSTGQGGSYQDTIQAPDNDSRNAVI